MCEFEKRLIAWMDGELDADAAIEVEQHVFQCVGCSARTAGYREISQALAAYCALTPIQRKASRLRRVAVGASAILTTAAAMILWMLRPVPQALPIPQPQSIGVPSIALKTTLPNRPAAVKAVHRAAARPVATARWTSVEPIVEIVIPADEVFAPGAMPAGVTFAADMSIAGDGSAEALRVRPALYLKK